MASFSPVVELTLCKEKDLGSVSQKNWIGIFKNTPLRVLVCDALMVVFFGEVSSQISGMQS